MPSIDIVSCETRSPPASPVQSPPRKKFKLSLKLKPKKLGIGKKVNVDDTEKENKEQECTAKGDEESVKESLTNSPDVSAGNSSSLIQEDKAEVTPPLPFAGLANLGNTCYLNAVLQVLRYCPEFLQFLASLDENISIPERTSCQAAASVSMGDNKDITPQDDELPLRPSIIHSVHKLTSEMQIAEENYEKFGMEADQVKIRSGCTTLAVRPRNFVKEFSGLRPLFAGYQQHDAQEFLRSFLSLVEEECIGLGKADENGDCVKENVTQNTSELKVKGGCKYPRNGLDNVMETIAEPTSMTSTADFLRGKPECPEDEAITKAALATKVATKSIQKDSNCSQCSPLDERNMVRQLFEGTLLLQTCCLSCEGVRRRYESFQDISVPVQQNKENTFSDLEEVSALSDSENEGENDVSLSWAISKFASVERLQGENKYFCDNCATLTEAEISTYFQKLPRVLTIHLKRFQTSYGPSLYSGSWVTKVTKSLHTPQRLSLRKWCSKTCSGRSAVYKLFGVVMHSGISSCSGHYLSYVNVNILHEQGDCDTVATTSECKCWKVKSAVSSPVLDKSYEAGISVKKECGTVEKNLPDNSCTRTHGNYCSQADKPDSRQSGEHANFLVSEKNCDEGRVKDAKNASKEDAMEIDDGLIKEGEKVCRVIETQNESASEDEEGIGQDKSCSKSWGVDITKYFKPLRKRKASVGKSAVFSENSSDWNIGCETIGISRYSAEDTVPLTEEVCVQPELKGAAASNGHCRTHGSLCDQTYCVEGCWQNPSTHGENCLQSLDLSSTRTSPCAKWLKFDDAEVQEISEKDVNEILSPSSSCYSTPYLLFYFRC